MRGKEKLARYNIVQNFLYIMGGAKKWQPSLLFFMPMWSLAEGLLPFVWLFAARILIERVETGRIPEFSFVLIMVGFFAIIELILSIMQQAGSKKVESKVHYVRTNFMQLTIKKVMTMPYEMMEDPKVLDAKRRSDKAVGNMVEGMEGLVKNMGSVLGFFLMMVVAAIILWKASPVLVILMFVLSVWRAWFGEKYAKWEKTEVYDVLPPYFRKSDYFNQTTRDFEAAKDIRVFDMKDRLSKIQNDIHSDINDRLFQMMDMIAKCKAKQKIIEIFQEGIMYAVLVYGVIKGNLGIAEFTLLVGSVRNFNQSLGNSLGLITQMRKDNRYMCDFRAFLEYPEGVNEGGEKILPQTNDGGYTFVFKNVSFCYPGREEYALRNLNITLEAGKRIAVVGLNGAGKTTFIKLLCRLYEPTEGVIYLNGIDIKTIKREAYYKLISPVFQNVECFAFPLTENVSMQEKEKTDQARAKACMIEAGLKETLEKLPQGVDTEILKILKTDGVELSGGEKQKMALARALYKNAPIVVLDEPTAALDPIAEYNSYMNFDKLIGNKTAVYISHRLSSTRFCQAIAMFDNGEMIEYGTHESLMEKGGAYAEMFALQAQYYKEDSENE